jgi:hypothetical protein
VPRCFLGDDLDAYLDDIVTDLLKILKHPSSDVEQNDALGLICILAIQRFSEFDSFARTIIEQFVQGLRGTPFLFYTVAFIASIGLSANNAKEAVVSKYVELLTNKRSRNIEFTPNVISECLEGLSLMLSVLPVATVIEKFFDDISHIIRRHLMYSQAFILSSVVDLVAIVHECMRVGGTRIPVNMDEFCDKFCEIFKDLPCKVSTRADRRALIQQCREVEKGFGGDVKKTKLGLNVMRTIWRGGHTEFVTIYGFRKHIALAAVRRVVGDRFLQQMSHNVFLHQLFEITKAKNDMDYSALEMCATHERNLRRAARNRVRGRALARERDKKADVDGVAFK